MLVNIRFLSWEKWEKLSPSEKKEWAEKISSFCKEMKKGLRDDTLEKSMEALSDHGNVAFFLNNRKNFIMALREGRVVGLLGFGSGGEKKYRNEFVAVPPTVERSGISTKLILACNSYARRRDSSVEIDFRSPSGRNFGTKLINMRPRIVYKKEKPVHMAEEYAVFPEQGNIHAKVRTAVPFRSPPTQKPWLRQLRTLWRKVRRNRGR